MREWVNGWADQRGVRGHGQTATRGRGHDRSGYLQGEGVMVNSCLYEVMECFIVWLS